MTSNQGCPFSSSPFKGKITFDTPQNSARKGRCPMGGSSSSGGCPFITSEEQGEPGLFPIAPTFSVPALSPFWPMIAHGTFLELKTIKGDRKVWDTLPLCLKESLFFSGPEYDRLRGADVGNRFFAAEVFREEGHKLFAKNQKKAALFEYSRALSLFLWLEIIEESLQDPFPGNQKFAEFYKDPANRLAFVRFDDTNTRLAEETLSESSKRVKDSIVFGYLVSVIKALTYLGDHEQARLALNLSEKFAGNCDIFKQLRSFVLLADAASSAEELASVVRDLEEMNEESTAGKPFKREEFLKVSRSRSERKSAEELRDSQMISEGLGIRREAEYRILSRGQTPIKGELRQVFLLQKPGATRRFLAKMKESHLDVLEYFIDNDKESDEKSRESFRCFSEIVARYEEIRAEKKWGEMSEEEKLYREELAVQHLTDSRFDYQLFKIVIEYIVKEDVEYVKKIKEEQKRIIVETSPKKESKLQVLMSAVLVVVAVISWTALH